MPLRSLLVLVLPVLCAAAMTISSSAFQRDGGSDNSVVAREGIPLMFGKAGDGVSPPLYVAGAPEGTQAFSLVLENVATKKVHWLAINLPGGTNLTLEEEASSASIGVDESEALKGAREGVTSFRKRHYAGLTHRGGGGDAYRFKVYALLEAVFVDAEITKAGIDKADLMALQKGKVLGMASLTATFKAGPAAKARGKRKKNRKAGKGDL